MYSRENYREAKKIIEDRRLSAEAEADLRNAEVRASYPEIAEIDRELTGTGLALFKIACAGGDIEPLKRRNQELVAKRRSLLSQLGLGEDYTDVRYTCPLCKDTGYRGSTVCKCLKEMVVRMNIRSSGMGHLVDKQTFDNFDLGWYAGDERAYKVMQSNVAAARAFAEGLDTVGGSLLLLGTTGTGKTHLSSAIAGEALRRGFDVVYDSAQTIVDAFADDRFRSGYRQTESRSEKYNECELLIIDDLGAEFVNQFSISVIYNLLNLRSNRGLSTVVSTNLSAKELLEKYEGRIHSRLIGGDFRVLQFMGRDHRVFK